ncbi:hypothetical protein COLU111180_15535 [Cohnella lubricantis]|uniref:Uncharacterized protein n=1 Tax=Cohnella lubricantis TaxID=2163172 RepID=A0A841TGR9_9BACL|nr:hypothetical protein [Cohnella lubricantis]MBB6678147.1 hypothetical protein [Cohnella lubricantis]MBP2120641.1 hypothetical protein [Cohnella lubricantis]
MRDTMRKGSAPWAFLLAVVCVLPLQAVNADENRYEPVPKSEGMQTVYIADVENRGGRTYLKVDSIEWYEGEAANEAFREHEQDPDVTEAPDGYYIVNDAEDWHTYELAPDADIHMQFYNRTGDWTEAVAVWDEKIDAPAFVSLFTPDDEEIMEGFPYHVTVENGKIVKLVQQFIP